MTLNKTYTTEVDLSVDTNNDVVITSISGSTAQLTATSFMTGPQGPQGNPGTPGAAGPNLVDTTTSTTLAGVLKGNGTHVALAVADTDYQRPLTVTNIGSSGAATLVAGVLNIPNYAAASSVLTTKGDLYGFSTVNARIPVGSDGQVLTADSTQPLGLKWAPGAAGSIVYDVKASYGAAGDGTTNDTTAIQNAINAAHAAGGGIVWFPAGTYKLTSALTVYQHIQLWGAGDGPLDGTGAGGGTAVATLKQTSTTANAITGVDVYDLTIRDLAITGPNSGTGVGISLTRSTSGDCRYIHLIDLTVQQFGSHGIYIDLPIVSVFQQVISYQNGGNGFHIIATGGAASTSCEFVSCWANNNTGIGYNINTMVYSTFTACAADTNGSQGYLFTGCQGVTLNSCGAEANTGNSFKFTGCYNITATAIWTYHNSSIGWYVTGSSVDVALIGFHENTPSGSPTASIKVDTGCLASIMGYYVVTAVSLATGTTNVMNDPSGNMTVQGQLNLPNMAKIVFGGDSDLYRLGANSLATDGKLTAFGGLVGSSFQLTATTTAGWVLTTDASGNGTWQAPTGGGASLSANNTWTGSQTFNLGKLLDKGEIVFDVKAYGATGNGTTDDTAAIQSAVDAAHTAGGGVVWFPAGTYKLVTNPIKLYSGTTPTITSYCNITLRGAGSDGGTGTIIKQTTTGVDVVKALNDAANGAQSVSINIENLCVAWGTGTLTNSGHGIYFAQQAANGPAFLQCNITNVRAQNFQGTGKYGFNFESLIVSTLQDCHSVLNTGGYFLNGASGGQYGSVNTSVTLINCYANASLSYGYRIVDSTYLHLSSCAADISSNVTTAAYSVEGCNAISFNSCGFELDGTHTLADGFLITSDAASSGSQQIGLYNCYGFQSKSTVEIYVTGSSVGVTVIGYQSNSSISGSTGLKADTGTRVTDIDCLFDTGTATPRNINAGATNMTLGNDDAPGAITIKNAMAAATFNALTLTANATGFQIAGGTTSKTLKINNTLTLAGTDSTTMTFPSTSGNVIASATAIGTVSGTPSSSTFLRGDGTWAAAGGSGTATPTASTNAQWDANVNMSANNFIDGFTTTATAAGTTTLTITSTGIQVFTGSTTQTVKLPTTGVVAGGQYQIINNSTGAVTVQSSGANTITILAAGTSAIFTAVVATPTTAANWNSQYIGISIASGKALSVSNSLTLAGTDATTMTFPSTSATIARTDAAQTFTGVQTFSSAPSFGALPTGSGVASAATASTLAARDSNGNLTSNTMFQAFATTATAAGTTTLSITSAPIQVFTGSTTQTVKLPTNSVPAGAQYIIVNQSTGAVTVQSSGANTITILAAGTSATFTAVVATPTTAANWNSQYMGVSTASGKVLTASNSLTLAGTDGKTLTVNNSITLSGTDSTTMTLPSTSATIARTDAAQTFTGVQTFSGIVNTTNQAITVTTNAGTADISHGLQTFTNSSAAAMTITLTTTSAVDGQIKILRIYDFSAVAQTITHVNTENSSVSVAATSNGSTTLPLTEIFQYNGSTSKWRCIGVI